MSLHVYIYIYIYVYELLLSKTNNSCGPPLSRPPRAPESVVGEWFVPIYAFGSDTYINIYIYIYIYVYNNTNNVRHVLIDTPFRAAASQAEEEARLRTEADALWQQRHAALQKQLRRTKTSTQHSI